MIRLLVRDDRNLGVRGHSFILPSPPLPCKHTHTHTSANILFGTKAAQSPTLGATRRIEPKPTLSSEKGGGGRTLLPRRLYPTASSVRGVDWEASTSRSAGRRPVWGAGWWTGLWSKGGVIYHNTCDTFRINRRAIKEHSRPTAEH